MSSQKGNAGKHSGVLKQSEASKIQEKRNFPTHSKQDSAAEKQKETTPNSSIDKGKKIAEKGKHTTEGYRKFKHALAEIRNIISKLHNPDKISKTREGNKRKTTENQTEESSKMAEAKKRKKNEKEIEKGSKQGEGKKTREEKEPEKGSKRRQRKKNEKEPEKGSKKGEEKKSKNQEKQKENGSKKVEGERTKKLHKNNSQNNPQNKSKKEEKREKKNYEKHFPTRMSMEKLVVLMGKLNDARQEAVKTMGFEHFLHLKVTTVPDTLGRWLVQNFDPEEKCLNISNDRKIFITPLDVYVTMGLPLGSKEIIEETHGSSDAYNVVLDPFLSEHGGQNPCTVAIT